MAWIKGILEGLKGLRSAKATKTAKEVKAVVNAPKVATTKNIARTTKVASEQTKTISSLRRAGGEVAGRIPKAMSKRSIVAGATAGFAGGALTMAMLSPSAPSSPAQNTDEKKRTQTIEGQIIPERQTIEGQITPEGQTIGQTTEGDLLSRANELSGNVLSPLEGIPILGGVVKEAKEEGFSFPLLIALIAGGGLLAYGVYRFVKKKKKAQKVNK